MRYLPLSQLRAGMELAVPLDGVSYSILLNSGVRLTANHLKRVADLGYPGVYVEDRLSRGIAAEDVISDRVRREIIQCAHSMFQQLEQDAAGKGSRFLTLNQQRIMPLVVESLSANPYPVVDRIDMKPLEGYRTYHAARVTVFSVLVGLSMGFGDRQLRNVGLASLLHDMGSIFVPGDLLDKPGALTPAEYEAVKQHTERGFAFLRDNYDIPIEACMGALQHHERYDGSGYPSGLCGDRISLIGRILAVTSSYDAMTSPRPYRRIMAPCEAMGTISQQAGSLFDPKVVEVFHRIVAAYPSGTLVELSDGTRCIVVENYYGDTERPRLRVIQSAGEDRYIDLHGNPDLRGLSIKGMSIRL